MMFDLVLTIVGAGLVLFVAYDVYGTVLHARGTAGPIGEAFNRSLWRAARAVAFRLSRKRRHHFLNAFGPLFLPALIAIYLMLLVAGFALIYYPRMPAEFAVDPEASSPRWIQAIYLSGVTLTTVGYGDITPRSVGMRVVAMVHSAAGFALISLTITYLLTVYRALERKRTIGLALYQQADEGADVAGFITNHFVAGRFLGFADSLRDTTRDMQEMLEAHFEHPVIHYFHPTVTHKSLPRMLFLVLETCAVIRSCLGQEHEEVRRHPDVKILESTARYVLNELIIPLGLKSSVPEHVEPPFAEARRWRERFARAMKRLREAGIETEREDAAWEAYRAQREEWEASLYRFAIFLGYDWDEITGDREQVSEAAGEEAEESEARDEES